MHLYFRVKFEPNLSLEEFQRTIGAPFVKALLEEMHATFGMPSIDPNEALSMLDPVDLPTENVAENDKEKLEILFDFYQKLLHSSCCQPTPNKLYTQKPLALEYKYYKEYITSQRNDL